MCAGLALGWGAATLALPLLATPSLLPVVLEHGGPSGVAAAVVLGVLTIDALPLGVALLVSAGPLGRGALGAARVERLGAWLVWHHGAVLACTFAIALADESLGFLAALAIVPCAVGWLAAALLGAVACCPERAARRTMRA